MCSISGEEVLLVLLLLEKCVQYQERRCFLFFFLFFLFLKVRGKGGRGEMIPMVHGKA
jgi:hypothetical protein